MKQLVPNRTEKAKQNEQMMYAWLTNEQLESLNAHAKEVLNNAKLAMFTLGIRTCKIVTNKSIDIVYAKVSDKYFEIQFRTAKKLSAAFKTKENIDLEALVNYLDSLIITRQLEKEVTA